MGGGYGARDELVCTRECQEDRKDSSAGALPPSPCPTDEGRTITRRPIGPKSCGPANCRFLRWPAATPAPGFGNGRRAARGGRDSFRNAGRNSW